MTREKSHTEGLEAKKPPSPGEAADLKTSKSESEEKKKSAERVSLGIAMLICMVTYTSLARASKHNFVTDLHTYFKF